MCYIGGESQMVDAVLVVRNCVISKMQCVENEYVGTQPAIHGIIAQAAFDHIVPIIADQDVVVR